jgi:predicted NUDIX family NTP pyrophosphohydrolase
MAGKRTRFSCGLVFYRVNTRRALEVLLAHPGGPYWSKKDAGVWTIPKGEPKAAEADLLSVAKREFEEETGFSPEAKNYEPLGTITQKGGKVVYAWACEGDFDARLARSNTFEIEWPPRSGRKIQIPEVDRCEWFDIESARVKLKDAQHPFLDRLLEKCGHDGAPIA